MPKGSKYIELYRGVSTGCQICGLNYTFKNVEYSRKLLKIHIKKTHNIDVPIDQLNNGVIVSDTKFTPCSKSLM